MTKDNGVYLDSFDLVRVAERVEHGVKELADAARQMVSALDEGDEPEIQRALVTLRVVLQGAFRGVR